MKLVVGLIVSALGLAACGPVVQTTSGGEYLQRYQSKVPSSATGGISPDIAAAASLEPVLTLPARIGIARIEGGALSPIPEAEAAAWLQTAQRLGPSFGEFIPVSPLITAMARQAVPPLPKLGCYGESFGGCVEQTVRDIRLGAARQHLDVVLMYEVAGQDRSSSNPLAVTKLVLIGLFLPTENVKVDGIAQALLVDVRNGYTYGFASASAKDAASSFVSFVNGREARKEVADEAKLAAVRNLTGEVEKMALRLRAELAEKRM